ncbi:Tfp pilus assembly protein PilF [Stella humosa]|uniref:Tfp pilus assembly protein PilF n=1 Tax=Stella humosa TaxID=94 RepID=A0A3N1ME28_9PROT|nr:tetratricopeptide repeat protein [Stella humosa]ROQ01375.1 Tfp pilus assembly protein PilF [Stella humosa]BBK31750.1 hypothetical protein STHU_23840 [Stella humosa]
MTTPPPPAAELAAIRGHIARTEHAAAAERATALAGAHPGSQVAWLLLAKAMVSQAKPAEAEAAMARAAALGPLPADAKSDQAATCLLRRDFTRAAALIAEAIAEEPENPVIWRRSALIEERAGNLAAAEAAYRRALHLAPDDAALHNNYGIFLRSQDRNDAAAHALRQAMALEPKRVEFLVNYAATLRHDGQADAALRAFREAIALAPTRDDVRLSTIGILRAMGRTEQAIHAAREGIEKIPESVRLRVALAATLLDSGRAADALAAAEAALAFRPDHHEALLHLGNALRQLERRTEAADAYRRLLVHQPDDVQAMTNLALVLMELGDLAAASPLAERAIALAPRNADALHVVGTIASVAGDLAGAERKFRAAIEIRPTFVEAQFSLGWLQLSQGKFREGQVGFDRRWDLPRFDKWRRPFAQPLWNGRPLAGRHLLIWGDHGPGDEIMYGRLIATAAAAGGKVTLECDRRLVRLFADAFPAIEVVPRSDPPHPSTRAADLQCPTGSLLGRLHAGPDSLPREPIAHLRADAARARTLRARYQDRRLLIGLSWNSRHPTIGDEKSVGLAAWEPILRTPGCRFVSVQYGDHRDEIEAVTRATGVPILVDPEIDPLTDYDGAAAQLAALDLVISISNTGAHLSAALGIPTWTMLTSGRGLFWYWLLGRSDTPWYPTMRLYRQQADRDWGEMIGRVARDLHALRR